eukprot:2811472-Amphidinium_carterae.3
MLSPSCCSVGHSLGNAWSWSSCRVESVLVPGRLVFGRPHLTGLTDAVTWLSVRLDIPLGVVRLCLPCACSLPGFLWAISSPDIQPRTCS